MHLGARSSGSGGRTVKLNARTTADPSAALDAVLADVEPAIYLFRDFHPYLLAPPDGPHSNLPIIRRLRDLAYRLRDTYKTLILVSPFLRLAPELEKDVTVLDFGLPSTRDFHRLLKNIIDEVKDNPRLKVSLDAQGVERLLSAAKGLTLREAENVFAKTLVLDGRLDADDVSVVYSEKKQIIQKGGLLEYCEPEIGLEDVGGLSNLKDWLGKRRLAFGNKAAEFGLPAPKGILLLGVQGCGKSLCAKAVASLWRLPLLRFDMGRMFGSLVGSSEENVRKAIQTAECIAPCILWIDEIDKAFSGLQGSSGSDGGTTARVVSTVLTWLSEKVSPVFVIATANDIRQLPPELLRKGRLDEIFFVDLPASAEREQILKIHLEQSHRDPKRYDLPTLVSLSEGFSGAEIREAIVSALFDAFSASRDLVSGDIAKALKETVPLSKTMHEEITRLRQWAQARTRSASGEVAVHADAEVRRKIEF
ncbi:MAG: AAA family ATPase [Planctomycetota bacterium]